tara:strand:- start:230 stop:358 length:129 start_codon:yes stop_codon:yes gene_type:complete
MKAWPILLGIITLIIVLSKLDLRVAVVEEKLKAIFDLINKRK